MSRCCHECGRSVGNPFYEMSALITDKQTGRIALSNVGGGVDLCDEDFGKISGDLHATPNELESSFGYAIDGVTGACGGLTGSVQVSSGVYDRHCRYKFVDRNVGVSKLPRCSRDLFLGAHWLEYADGKFIEAPWASALYHRAHAELVPPED